MVLATDQPVPPAVIEELRQSPGILQVQAVSD
jgi:predicted regulator of amino acid metabolism with ACT domain